MTAKAKGIDVSTWQHPGGAPIDWEKVLGAGVTFVVVKATQGLFYVNPWAERDIEDAFAAGLLVGAYHYFVVGDDAVAQAKHFTGTLIGRHLDLGAWLDFEPAYVNQYTASSWVNSFLDEVKEARPARGLYCNLSWWGLLKETGVNPPALWVAEWGDSAPAGATIWQSSESGTVDGVPAEVDINWLVGTRGVNLPTAPGPKPGALAPKAEVTTPVAWDDEPAEGRGDHSGQGEPPQ